MERTFALDDREAYLAAYAFVKDYYDRSPTESIFLLLHAMELLGEDDTNDPGTWNDWLVSVRRVVSGAIQSTEPAMPPEVLRDLSSKGSDSSATSSTKDTP